MFHSRILRSAHSSSASVGSKRAVFFASSIVAIALISPILSWGYDMITVDVPAGAEGLRGIWIHEDNDGNQWVFKATKSNMAKIVSPTSTTKGVMTYPTSDVGESKKLVTITPPFFFLGAPKTLEVDRWPTSTSDSFSIDGRVFRHESMVDSKVNGVLM